MTAILPIPVTAGPVRGSIRPPGSKSITNRALVCAGLARGESRLTGVLDSEDTRVMAAGLAALGIRFEADWAAGEVRITGQRRHDSGDGGHDRLPRPAARRCGSCRPSAGSGTARYRLDGTAADAAAADRRPARAPPRSSGSRRGRKARAAVRRW